MARRQHIAVGEDWKALLREDDGFRVMVQDVFGAEMNEALGAGNWRGATCHKGHKASGLQRTRRGCWSLVKVVMFVTRGTCRIPIANTCRDELEQAVRGDLSRTGWSDRAEALVIPPELEVWIWSRTPNVVTALGWECRRDNLFTWLEESGHWSPGEPEPCRPEEALEAALWKARVPRSSAICRQVSASVSLKACTAPSFHRLASVLRDWFGRGGGDSRA